MRQREKTWISNQMKNTNMARNPGVLGVWPISTRALSSHLVSVSQTQPSRNTAPTATHICTAAGVPFRARVTGTHLPCGRSCQCAWARTCMVTAGNASHFIPSLSCYCGHWQRLRCHIHVLLAPKTQQSPSTRLQPTYLCIP